MSNVVVILGESGTGKSTSLRNLNPDETFIINVLNKPLPFRGYKKMYNEENKNFLDTDDYRRIMPYLKAINERRPDIKSIVIDDFSFLMNNEFMHRCREKGYDKFTDMGSNVFNIMDICQNFRDDLYCYLLCHTEKDHAGMIKPKTVGKMTADYVGLAERSTIVLHTQIVDGHYSFLTQNDGLHVAKTPMGMFEEVYIDNDLQKVRNIIDEYYNGPNLQEVNKKEKAA
jgi:hypothetical protein